VVRIWGCLGSGVGPVPGMSWGEWGISGFDDAGTFRENASVFTKDREWNGRRRREEQKCCQFLGGEGCTVRTLGLFCF
jgi:hypothetical protein